MVKRMLCLVIGIMFLFGGNGDCGIITGGDYAVSAGPDYVPAEFIIREGASANHKYKVAILNDDGTYVSNSISSEQTTTGSQENITITLNDCDALIPGSSYRAVIVRDTSTFPKFCVSGPLYSIYTSESGTYASPGSVAPSTDPEFSVNSMFEFSVKNANGDVLFSNGDLTSTSEVTFQSHLQFYDRYSDECATL